MREVIQQVVAAEERAKGLVAAARTQAERLLADARRQAEDLTTRGRQEVQREVAELVTRAVEDARREKTVRLDAAARAVAAEVTLPDAVRQAAVETVIRCVCRAPPG